MIMNWLLSIGIWILGRILYHVGHKTCGEVDGKHYIGFGQYTRRECILAPGHFSACVTEWEWNLPLKRWVRFWFASDSTGTYARSELH